MTLILNLAKEHVSPQYHVVFDKEFSTIPYLKSREEPPNWLTLVKDSSEHATEEQVNISDTWYERPASDSTTTDCQNVSDSHQSFGKTRKQEEPNATDTNKNKPTMLVTPNRAPSGPRNITVISIVKTQIQTLIVYLKQFNKEMS